MSRAHGYILESQGFYRFLLQKNVYQFNFIFFKEYFFIKPVTEGELKVMNFHNFFFVDNRIGSELTNIQIKLHQKKHFLLTRDFRILMDLSAIICFH